MHFRGHKQKILPKSIKKLFKIESAISLNKNKNSPYLYPCQISSNGITSIIDCRDSPIHGQCKQKNSTEQNHLLNLKKTLKSIQKSAKIQKKEKNLASFKEFTLFEWKECARKLDLFMFMVSAVTVLIAPFYLFGEYFVFDKSINLSDYCSCV